MKIKSIKKVGKHNVYDISVKDVQHYVLENGVVTHNTGLIYSSNQAFIIGKSQEKDGTDLVGWNFTINIEKSRFVKEKSKFPFTVLFDGGIQKYSGILDVAIEGKFVIKPSNGWYSKVDPETGEVEEKKYRFSDTQTSEFMESILNNSKFQEYVRKRYEIAYGSIIENISETEVPENV